ncbi:MAG: amino acid ABC transporter substrate-binding protein [Gammaproteobacteria bacterium]|nr:MAG: amino acid ABC transporter substrate-binding protein [Gammaproteobacteria bacterium]
MKMFKILAVAAVCAAAGTVQASATLDAVKDKGFIQCGVHQGLPGFANPDDQGDWAGLDIDFCRAMAAAVLGDAEAVKFTPLSAKVRFTALTSGEIDILPRTTTWTMSRDTDFGDFIGVNYYDGQGFLVPKDLGVASATELDGAAVCTNTGTTTELNVADYFRANGMQYTVVAFEKSDEVLAAYDAGRCDVYTTDRSGLAAQRTKLSKPDEHIVLPEIISKEPLGPMVRHGDNQWADIARWTLNCMVNAEEAGITSENVAEMAKSKNPDVRRILGEEGDLGKKLGIPNDFCATVVAQVGNYGESYDRNVGPDTPLQLDRGLNALWKDGGILYAPPMR